jgi:hypothetical protein
MANTADKYSFCNHFGIKNEKYWHEKLPFSKKNYIFAKRTILKRTNYHITNLKLRGGHNYEDSDDEQ